MGAPDAPLNAVMRKLQQMRDDGAISAEEYRRKAAAAMDAADPEKAGAPGREGRGARVRARAQTALTLPTTPKPKTHWRAWTRQGRA